MIRPLRFDNLGKTDIHFLARNIKISPANNRVLKHEVSTIAFHEKLRSTEVCFFSGPHTIYRSLTVEHSLWLWGRDALYVCIILMQLFRSSVIYPTVQCCQHEITVQRSHQIAFFDREGSSDRGLEHTAYQPFPFEIKRDIISFRYMFFFRSLSSSLPTSLTQCSHHPTTT